MRILLLCHRFNSLSQRFYCELSEKGHEVSVELDVHPELTIEAVNLYKPDLIIAPFLKRKIPKEVWEKHLTLVVVYGDRGYRGCEGVIVCDSREMRAKRQVVEGVISQIKLFNAGSGWRTLTCVLVYTYAYAIGYSYYRRDELEV